MRPTLAAPAPRAEARCGHRSSSPHAQWRAHPVAAAAAWLCVAGSAQALPQGGQTSFGQAQIAVAQPGQMTITQGTASAGIDWASFSLARGETLRVLQPSASAVLFNRVLGDDPSSLLGRIDANGRIYLSNPRGVLFGRDAVIDVGGLVATTLAWSTAAASGIAGNSGNSSNGGNVSRLDLSAAAGSTGELRMEGLIRAPQGTVALAGPNVTVSGRIEAARIGVAAAGRVQLDMDGDGLVFFNASSEGLDARLQMLGTLRADGGSVDLRAAARAALTDTVLNVEGVVQARGLAQRNGRIVIDGGTEGITRIAGRVDVASTDAQARGGEITALGRRVLLDGTARLDASGPAGGGGIRVGGDYQGGNPLLHNAEMLTVLPGARLNADATTSGDGGRIILWSDRSTRFGGAVSARGAGEGAAGGFAEVSGRNTLEFTGTADLASPRGRAGQLLLDPDTLHVVATGDSTTDGLISPTVLNPPDPPVPGQGNIVFSDLPAAATLSATKVQTVLNSGTAVHLQATTLVSVDVPITATATTSALTLESGSAGAVALGANVTTNGAVSVIAGSGGITQLTGTTLNSGGGTIALTSSTGSIALAGTLHTTDTSSSAIGITTGGTLALGNIVTSAGARVTVQHGGAGSQTAGTLLSGAGSLLKTGVGTLTLSQANSFSGGTRVEQGVLTLADAAALSSSGAVVLANSAELRVATSTTIGSLADATGASASVVVDDGTTLTVNNASGIDTSFGGEFRPPTTGVAGQLVKSGAGSFTLTSTVLTLGGTSVTDGRLVLASGVTLPAGKPVVVSGSGQLEAASTQAIGALSGDGNVVLGTGASLSVEVASGTSAFSGAISGGTGLTKTGAGQLTLSGTNTYGGATTVSAGTLALSGGTALPDTSAVTLGATGTPTLALAGSETIGSLASTNTAALVTMASGAVLTVANATGGDTGFAGVIGASEAGSGLTKQGAGSFTVSGSVNVPVISITGGALALGASNLLADTAAVSISGTGALLDIGTRSDSIGSLSLASGAELRGSTGSLSVSTATTLNGSQINALLTTSTLASSGSSTLANAVVASTSARVDGGQLTIGSPSGTLTTPTLSLNAGTLVTAAATRLANTPDVTMLAGSAWQMAGAETLQSLAGTGTLTLGAGAVLTTGGTASTTFSGTLAGASAGGVVKQGTGTWTLNGTNTFAGPTSVLDGTLALSGSQALPDSSAVTLTAAQGATLSVLSSETIGGLASTAAGANSANVTLANGAVLTVNAAGNGRLEGSISGGNASSGLTKSGAGVLTLAGAHTYGGNTRVLGGQIVVPNGASLPAGTAVEVAASSNLTLSDSHSVGALAGAGSVTLGNSAVLTVNTASPSTFSGAIGGGNPQSGLTKQGAGTLILSGSNTYAGPTTVSQGVLQIGDGGTSGELPSAAGSTVQVQAGATLRYARTDSFVLPSTASISGGGAFEQAGGSSSVITLNAALAAATVTVSGGTLALGASHLLANTAALSVSGATSVLDIGTASDTIGTLALSSGGQLRGTSGALEVSGATTLNGGQVNATLHTATLASSGTSALNAAVSASLSTEVNGGQLTVNGASGTLDTLILAVNAGSLVTGGAARLLNAPAVTMAGGAAWQMAGAESLRSLEGAGTVTLGAGAVLSTGTGAVGDRSFSGNLVGATAGGVVKAGSGRWLLSGTNTFGGSTTVDAGTLEVQGGAALPNTTAVTLGASGTPTLALAQGEAIGSLASGNSNARVTLADGAVLTVANAAGGDTTFAGRISGGNGASGLLKQGAGQFTLSGTNTYAGSTTVSAGTLAATTATALPSGTAAAVAAGGVLSLSGAATLSALSGAGTVTLADGVVLTVNTNGDSTFAGAISGGNTASGLSKSGSGTLVLSGTSSFQGPTLVAGGVLQIGNGGSTGQLPATATSVQVDAGATLRFARSDSFTLPFTVTGSGRFEQAGGAASVITLGSGLGAAAVAINGGTLALGASDLLANAAAVSVSGASSALDIGTASDTIGSLSLSGGARVLGASGSSGSLSVSGATTLDGSQINAALQTATLISTGNSALNAAVTASASARVDSGQLTVNAASGSLNTPSLTLNAGSLITGAAARLLGAPALVMAGGTAWQMTGAETLQSLAGAGTVTLGAGAVLTTGGAADASFSGTLVGATAGGVVKQGSGRWTLSGTNSLGGGVTVNAGTLALSGGAALPDSTAVTLGVSNSPTLALTQSETIGSLASANANARVTLADGAVLTVANTAGGNTSFAGQISGGNAASGLVKLGAGQFTLSGSNSYGGATTVGAGTLVIDASSSLPATSALSLASGATLSLHAGATAAGLEGSGGQVVLSPGAVLTMNTGSGTASSFGGSVSGGDATSGLVKQGAGSLTLSGINTFAGGTTVSGGALNLNGGQALPDTGSVTLAATAQLSLLASETLGGLAGSGTLTLAAGSVLTLNTQTDATFDGRLSGGGAGSALVKQGPARQRLGGSNDFSGNTLVQAGVLELAGGAALPDSGSLTLANTAGAGLSLLGSETLGTLSGGGSAGGHITLANGAVLTVDMAASAIYAGTIQGGNASSGLVKQGSSTLVLTGDHSFVGTTRVAQGVLQLGNAGSSGSLAPTNAVNVAADATLRFNRADAFSVASSVAGAGSVELAGAGASVLSLTGAWSPASVGVSSGTLAWGAADRIGNTTALAAAGPSAVLDLRSATDSLASLALSAGARLTGAAGSHLTVLGNTSLDAGHLQAALTSATLSIAGNTTLTSELNVASGVLINNADLSLSGAAARLVTPAITLNQGSLHSGSAGSLGGQPALTLSAGSTLNLAASESLGHLAGAGTVTLGAGAQLTLNPAAGAEFNFSGSLGGAAGTGLVLQGPGTQLLSGSNPFFGSVAVNGGTLALLGGTALPPTASVSVGPGAGATLALRDSQTLGGLSGSGDVSLADGAQLTLRTPAGTDFNLSGAISGGGATGGLIKQGDGGLTLAGTNTFAGTTVLGGGTLVLSGGHALADGAALQLDAGTRLSVATSEAVGVASGAGQIVLAPGAVLTMTVPTGQDAQLAGNISGGDASSGLLKLGAGRLTLAGTNSYGGSTTVGDGALQLTGGAALADTHAVVLANAAGVQLQVQANETLGSLAGGGAAGGEVKLASGVRLTLDSAAAVDTTFAGAINGADATATLVKQGAGRLTLGGVNGLHGITTVLDGTLALGVPQALPADAAVVLANAPGARLALLSAQSLGSLAGGGAAGGQVSLAAGATLTVNNAAGQDTLFAGTLSGGDAGSGLVKQGAGRFTLAGNNGYGGSTRVLGGVLEVTGGAALPDGSTLTLADTAGAALRVSQSETVGALAGGGAAGGAITLAPGAVLTVASPAGVDTTYAGAISGGDASSGLVKQGPGRLVFSGNNRYAGSTRVEAGTLALTGGAALPDSSAVQIANTAGARLELLGSETLGGLAGGGAAGGHVQLAPDAVLTLAMSTPGDSTFSGTLGGATGAGGLIKQGAARLLLAGSASAFAGFTTVEGGALVLAPTWLLPDAQPLIVRDASLQRDGSDTVGSLALERATLQGSGTLTAATATLDTGTVNAGLTVGSLSSTGASVLAAPVLASAGATVLGGRLDVLAAGSLSTPQLQLNAGELRTAASAGRLPGLPTTVLAAGTSLSLGASEALGSLAGAGTVDVAAQSVLSTGGSGDTSFSGLIGGAGGLRKTGSGIFTLASLNGFSGGTTIDAGTLVLGSAGVAGSVGSGNIVNNGLLIVDGPLQLDQVLSGSGALTKRGSGSLNVGASGRISAAGTLTVEAGSLMTAGAEQLADTATVTVGPGASLLLGGDETVGRLLATGRVVNVQGTGGSGGSAGSLLLSADELVATSADNDFGTGLLSLTARTRLQLSSGSNAGVARDLRLGTLRFGAAATDIGTLEAGRLTLEGDLLLAGQARLNLVSWAAPVAADAVAVTGMLTPDALPLFEQAPVIRQTAGRIDAAAGTLVVIAGATGSISLERSANVFGQREGAGTAVGQYLGSQGVQAFSLDVPVVDRAALVLALGSASWTQTMQQPWAGGAQASIRLAGQMVGINGAGVQADIVGIAAGDAATAPTATIVARLPFAAATTQGTVGRDVQVPALTLDLVDPLSLVANSLAWSGDISINLGSRQFGARTEHPTLNTGYVTVLPSAGNQGKVVNLVGPQVAQSGESPPYAFNTTRSVSDTGSVGITYNGFAPRAPQVESALSSVVGEPGKARQERLEDAVRTENVAGRLRRGVIAEVGPGAPATQGSEGIKQPAQCTQSTALRCAD